MDDEFHYVFKAEYTVVQGKLGQYQFNVYQNRQETDFVSVCLVILI